jgi:hypothetical protein
MRTGDRGQRTENNGYFLMEALVYIGVVGLLLGVGYAAMYRCIDNSVNLRRNADDIASALRAGERWRADLRTATQIQFGESSAAPTLHLSGPRGEIEYKFAEGTISRRLASGPWLRLLANVKSSAMQPVPRQKLTAWQWELELRPRANASVKASRIRPLFTFITVPQGQPAPVTASLAR